MAEVAGSIPAEPTITYEEKQDNSNIKTRKKRLKFSALLTVFNNASKDELDFIRKELGIIIKDKYPRKRVFDVPVEERIFSKKELKLFLSCVDDPKYLMLFKLMAFSGLRIGEATCIKLTDIDFNENCIYSYIEKKASKIILRNYYPAHFSIELRGYINLFHGKIDLKGYVFPNLYGDAIGTENSGDAFRKALKRAKLDRHYGISKDGRKLLYFTTHSLRRSFVSTIEEQAGLNVASKMIHHKDIRTTQKHYSGVRRERKIKAVEQAFNEFK